MGPLLLRPFLQWRELMRALNPACMDVVRFLRVRVWFAAGDATVAMTTSRDIRIRFPDTLSTLES
jgi:hypothetical protein